MTPSFSSELVSSARGRRTVLRAAWLYDGASSALLADPVVVLDGSKIVTVDTVRGTAVFEGADVVDLDGATLVPGLVDTHVHLSFDATDDPVGNLARRSDDAALAAMTAAARQAARGGVTTVRDLGDRGYLSLTLRAAARDGSDPTLPTIVAAGPPLTTPGGHCHYLGGEVSDISEVRTAIRAHAERGVDLIKIMASGGTLTPGTRVDLPQFRPDELHAAVDEAHRHGLPIVAHAHGGQAIAAAAAAGVDGLEHLTFVGPGGVEPAPADLVAALAAQRVVLGITLGTAPVADAVVPPWNAATMPALLANGRRLHDAGALIVPGTDAGIGRRKPPDTLRWAVGQFTRIGPTAVEALRAATSVAAAACGLGDRKGRLAPGYDADILVIDGDPLTDLDSLQRPRAVYLRGHRLTGTTRLGPDRGGV